jgi:hypothetical protein
MREGRITPTRRPLSPRRQECLCRQTGRSWQRSRFRRSAWISTWWRERRRPICRKDQDTTSEQPCLGRRETLPSPGIGRRMGHRSMVWDISSRETGSSSPRSTGKPSHMWCRELPRPSHQATSESSTTSGTTGSHSATGGRGKTRSAGWRSRSAHQRLLVPLGQPCHRELELVIASCGGSGGQCAPSPCAVVPTVWRLVRWTGQVVRSRTLVGRRALFAL